MPDVDLIEVLDGGLLTTVQDRGRFGYQRYGVPVSGAMDPFALRCANALVGNPDAAAGLEITLLGPRLRFLAAATIAVTGADLGAALDGRPMPRGQAVPVPRSATLSFDGVGDGARAYLAVAGGLDVPPVLGSRSTYLRSRLGGVEGRALKAGDRLGVLAGVAGMAVTAEAAQAASAFGTLDSRFSLPVYGHDHVLRVIPGPQDDCFTEAGIRTFLGAAYTVTTQSDRMGCRLAGPRIEHRSGPDIVSDGTPLGAVQVAGDGLPIVLLADRGTAGGYTKIATVISVDAARLGQAVPGDRVRFAAVSLEEAHQALCDEEAALERIRRSEGGKRAAGAGHRQKAAAAAAAIARLLEEGTP